MTTVASTFNYLLSKLLYEPRSYHTWLIKRYIGVCLLILKRSSKQNCLKRIQKSGEEMLTNANESLSLMFAHTSLEDVKCISMHFNTS